MSDETGGEAPPFALQRLGVVMEPRPGDPAEAWGVLNPAAARGRDGRRGYALRFPRLVGFREAEKSPEDATTVAELIAVRPAGRHVHPRLAVGHREAAWHTSWT